MTPSNREKLNRALQEITFGLEVEVTGISRYGSGPSIAQAINNAQGFNGRKAFKNVSDGSVTDGSEFVSGIMDYATDIEPVQEAVRAIHRAGGRPHYSCGIHVHIGGQAFIQDPKALVRLVRLVNRYENQLFHALGADTPQRRGRWAQPVDPRFMARLDALPKNPTIDQVRSAWYADWSGSPSARYHSSRYRLLNLHALFSKGTIEFRCFNATTHAGKVKAYIQLSALLCAYALISSKASRGTRSFDTAKAKYEVRTMLLKVGAVGEEYKTLRLHMTRHLEGNASWHRV
jgi:hypothetical protein